MVFVATIAIIIQELYTFEAILFLLATCKVEVPKTRRRTSGMGGLVIDIFIAYAIKACIIAWHRRGTSKWPVIEGLVDSVISERWWSTHVVSIAYSYEVGGAESFGSDDLVFFKNDAAYEYCRKVHPGMKIRIRVSPSEPDRSILD